MIPSLTRTMTAAALTALALLVVPSAAEGGKGDGTARYKYEVTGFDYEATASMVASRNFFDDQGGCVSGRSASWDAHVETGLSDLAPLGGLGLGSLRILERGAKGKVEARTEIESMLVDSGHIVINDCDDPDGTVSTDCSGQQVSSQVDALGSIEGGAGKRVSIDWRFRQVGLAGNWVPDTFSCVEPLVFPFDKCRSKAPLRSFTKKTLELSAFCVAETTTYETNYEDEFSTDVLLGLTLKRKGKS